ncbi:MAG TPA: hypothetical protein VEH10_01860 [Thermoplasmata archaeon]|nr:hypothetical protein [Thermoplasmata archaeon]
MNRSIAWVGVGAILAGMGLVAFPIVVTGREQLDPEQILGFLVAPVGLFIVLIAAVSVDPYRTTVMGTFGNPDETSADTAPPGVASGPSRYLNPNASVHCRACYAIITADLATCPRCARARECRGCRRPLGMVLDRPTCPTCARAEPFCNCPMLARPPRPLSGGTSRGSAL